MTLRRRVLLVLLAFSLVAAILIHVAGDAVLRASLRALAEERLERESELLADMFVARPDGATAGAAQGMVRSAALLGVRATLIDPAGTVVADSDVPPDRLPTLDNHLDRPEVREALARGTGRARRHSATVGVEMFYFARRLQGREGPVGFLRLAVPSAALEAGGDRLRGAISAISAGAFVLMSLVAWAFTRRLSAPVERIARAADRVASGGYDEPIRESGGSAEVDGLVSSLERMRSSLRDEIRAKEEERRILDTILSGMREGLLAVDVERRVILANRSLRRDLGLGDAAPEGRPLAEVLRAPGAVEAFSRALSERVEARGSVTVRFPAEKVFELLVAPLDAPDGAPLGAIGLLLDVTRLQALERMRREFIADLSHEMRTPLASMRAAVENLLGAGGADPSDRSVFLAILGRNIERVEALLNDLTDLSLIETGAIRLEPERVDLRGAVGDVAASLASLAASRGVGIAIEVPDGLGLRADRRRLDQILVNVVENAVKFNRQDGSVVIRASIRDGEVVVCVEDTGEGIPAGDAERIFQRFYRRDRARSREAGGTGLGLAIVKHLMRLHGGSVQAEGREGGGTRIVLSFPREARPASVT